MSSLDGGIGSDVLVGEAGDDTLTGGSGTDIFRFATGTATDSDTISDFEDGTDLIDVSFFGLSGVGDLTIINDGGGNAVITLPSGDSVTVTGIDQSQLADSDFLF